MRAGCYTLDIYCTKANAKPNGIAECGWEKHFAQFTGRTEASCLRQAKADGWRTTLNKELCPMHAEQARGVNGCCGLKNNRHSRKCGCWTG